MFKSKFNNLKFKSTEYLSKEQQGAIKGGFAGVTIECGGPFSISCSGHSCSGSEEFKSCECTDEHGSVTESASCIA